MTNPLEDPEVRDQLAKAGITHRPGMAAEIMEELAPLLKADGFDLDDLGDVDIDQLDTAMSRATERRNLELFTPVGERHTQALAVLRQVSTSIAEDDQETARAVLHAIDPDPGENAPSVAQVIGAALGLLDAWHSDPALRTASEATRAPKWGKRTSAAAMDILAIAPKGRAFDTLGRLIANHGGLAVLEASALTVAATLVSRAHVQGTSASELAGALLGADAPPAPAAASPLRSRPAPATDTAPPPPDMVLAREYRSWLGQQPYSPTSFVTQMAEDLLRLRGTLRPHGLDPYRVEDIPAIIEQLSSSEPDDLETQFTDLLTLDMYSHHRIDRAVGGEATAWDQAHDLIERAVTEAEDALEALDEELDEAFDSGSPLGEALREAEQIPAQERHQTLARTRLVSAVTPLLEWLGTGRSCSPAGGVRRADIEQVAALLDITAVGVSKRPPLSPSSQETLFPVDLDEPLPVPDTIYALSMSDVPVLAAWWRALIGAGLITRRKTRILPGPVADVWMSSSIPPLGHSEELVEAFLIHFLLQDLDKPGPLEWVDSAVTTLMVSHLYAASAPALAAPDASEGLHRVLLPRVRRKLQDLSDLGLLTVSPDGEFQVPPALRPAVINGVSVVVVENEAMTEEEDDDA
ncbi:MAG TPA: hypothetical protein VK053_25065 [Jiangellaceae bacterium]|nr:hypothetical protein [Jiangellaceae bacterium]